MEVPRSELSMKKISKKQSNKSKKRKINIDIDKQCVQNGVPHL
jgi:hypothetical protein